ncbi:lipase family protein [Spirosoma montaniterrae]|uniref:Fungal lipase-type domain-containing protein n=1 Tax=Spirosoma montaniterrae TaxID=1178516 RepID=A0A1P9WYM4_9BACT|nr:lipase family protein [Spirosoma montaniterrae]AQG80487.1 hypothetical protein AWR27_14840 [Spirosoma montaniterrae]
MNTPSFATGYSLAEAQLTMTLSTLAYIDETPLPSDTTPAIQAARMRADINAALAQSTYSGWQVAWGPGLSSDRSNMLYMAQNGSQYAVVIRGTDWSFFMNWVEDFASVLGLTAFGPANDASVQIADGTSAGLDTLQTLFGTAPDGTQTNLLSFLFQIDTNASVFVTGHSLGGCLASVVAAWLGSGQGLGNANSLKVYTFAAPSAGNAAFASYYNQLFTDSAGNSTAFRVYNSLDVVPNGWASLETVTTYYPGFVNCPTDIVSAINTVQSYISNDAYTQVGEASNQSAVELPGHLLFGSVQPSLDPISDVLFGLEAGWQHETANYLNLLNAKPILTTLPKRTGASSGG